MARTVGAAPGASSGAAPTRSAAWAAAGVGAPGLAYRRRPRGRPRRIRSRPDGDARGPMGLTDTPTSPPHKPPRGLSGPPEGPRRVMRPGQDPPAPPALQPPQALRGQEPARARGTALGHLPAGIGQGLARGRHGCIPVIRRTAPRRRHALRPLPARPPPTGVRPPFSISQACSGPVRGTRPLARTGGSAGRPRRGPDGRRGPRRTARFRPPAHPRRRPAGRPRRRPRTPPFSCEPTRSRKSDQCGQPATDIRSEKE